MRIVLTSWTRAASWGKAPAKAKGGLVLRIRLQLTDKARDDLRRATCRCHSTVRS
jgi:hypothetical protein